MKHRDFSMQLSTSHIEQALLAQKEGPRAVLLRLSVMQTNQHSSQESRAEP